MILQKEANVLRSLGYNNNTRPELFSKGPNTVEWVNYTVKEHWKVRGNFTNEYGINTIRFEEVLKVVGIMENPRTTIMDFLLKDYLDFDYFFTTLEPVILEYDLTLGSCELTRITYNHRYCARFITISWNILTECLTINDKIKIDQSLSPNTLKEILEKIYEEKISNIYRSRNK